MEAKSRASLLMALTYDPRWGQGVRMLPLHLSTLGRSKNRLAMIALSHSNTTGTPRTGTAGSMGSELGMHRWSVVNDALRARESGYGSQVGGQRSNRECLRMHACWGTGGTGGKHRWLVVNNAH